MNHSGDGTSRPCEAAVLERLRSLVASRVLPLTRPTRVWAGPCREAHTCIACGTIIGVGETEFDLVVASAQKVFSTPGVLTSGLMQALAASLSLANATAKVTARF